MKNSELRRRLEHMADRLEASMAVHRCPVKVRGGDIGPRVIRFFVLPRVTVRFNTLQALKSDMALALGVSTVRLHREKGQVVLEFPRPDPRVVDFTALLREVTPLPIGSVALGMTSDGAPLVARLPSPEVAHILIAGTTGSGKTTLLQSIAASLIAGHRPGVLRLAAIDFKAKAFEAFASAPQWAAMVHNAQEAKELLARALALMDQRPVMAEDGVRLVLLVDEMADLVTEVDGASAMLARLLQRGREAGIHVVAATQHPARAVLSGLMRANFPLRLVGKVATTNDASVAAGQGGTDAHLLEGRGDFLAVRGSLNIRFQVAKVNLDWARSLCEEMHQPLPQLLPVALPEELSRPLSPVQRLKMLIEEKGREPGSITEAARWLSGGNGGGQAFYEAREALEQLEVG